MLMALNASTTAPDPKILLMISSDATMASFAVSSVSSAMTVKFRSLIDTSIFVQRSSKDGCEKRGKILRIPRRTYEARWLTV